MNYKIQEGEFDLPDQLYDQTVNIFTITSSGESPFNIVITRSKTETPTLDQHVDREIGVMQQTIVGFRFLWKRNHQLGGRPAVIVATTIDREDAPIEQRQVFCLNEGGKTLTVTASAANRFDDQQMAWLNVFASSFRFTSS